ncbi:hypothetical protein KTN05_09610 [Paracoccus sp. Z118]|uniref:hypothetical protein n=1 Tax=Paracoccus sp. Z118 TaxID=2851017 RepID=UPI001C2CA501|nr:hypothetical protein [Paracoccus sp. Z118]MBV0892107.1 hypothetical protein [Paracoccus sp. Z118]
MIDRMRAVGLALLLLLAPGVAPAGPLTDRIMAPGLLADMPQGEALRYRHDRSIPAQPEGAVAPGAGRGLPVPRAVEGAELRLTPDGAGTLILHSDEAGESRPISGFPAAGGNPVLLFFLENVVRHLAVSTGGSPFYLRNRMVEALAAADLPPHGEEAVLAPFADDPNRDRLGGFADLRIALRLDPADPARLLELRAEAGAADYLEQMTLVTED